MRYALVRAALAVAAAGAATPAAAYVGPSYLQVAGIQGGRQPAPYAGWVRARAHYWASEPLKENNNVARERLQYFPLPAAPREGAGAVTVSIDKRAPSYRSLMRSCRAGRRLGDIRYAEDSDYFGSGYELGDRPAGVPRFFEYRLTGARITDCPEVAGAPEQAFTIAFQGIAWTNYAGPKSDVLALFEPSGIVPQREGPTTRSFVLTWFAVANDVSEDQCTAMSAKTPQEAYYRYLSPDVAARERAALAEQGGPNYTSNQMALRGPDRLNVPKLPGIVPDPGQPVPRPGLGRGLDLDGRGGIDNRLFAVQGCIAGLLGRRGYTPRFSNAMMRDGEYSILLQLTGVDDPRNDDRIELTWFYSADPMVKTASGQDILGDYTFRISKAPRHAHYFTRLTGRIRDGVIETDPIANLAVHMGKFGFPSTKRFHDARMRLELLPDGGIKGMLGGYMDLWLIQGFGSSQGEQQLGYDSSALYNALLRNADGGYDPVTREYRRISATFDIEGVAAFIIDRDGTQRASADGVVRQ